MEEPECGDCRVLPSSTLIQIAPKKVNGFALCSMNFSSSPPRRRSMLSCASTYSLQLWVCVEKCTHPMHVKWNCPVAFVADVALGPSIHRLPAYARQKPPRHATHTQTYTHLNRGVNFCDQIHLPFGVGFLSFVWCATAACTVFGESVVPVVSVDAAPKRNKETCNRSSFFYLYETGEYTRIPGYISFCLVLVR